jgi:hypothetical protein
MNDATHQKFTKATQLPHRLVPHPRFLRVGVLVWHAEGDWPWSSFSFYAKDQTALVVIDVVDL